MLAPLSWILVYCRKIFEKLYIMAEGILTCDLETAYDGALGGVVSTCQTEISSLCQTILAVCFFVEFIKIAIQMEGLDIKMLAAVLAKFGIAYSAMEWGGSILKAVYATSGEWIANIYGSSAWTVSGTILSMDIKLRDALNNAGFFEGLGIFILSLIAGLSLLAVGISLFLMAMGRGLEILFLTAVSPIPIALCLFDHGQVTKNFMLHFASVCIQGLTMILCMSLMPPILDDILIIDEFLDVGSAGTLAEGIAAAAELIAACFIILTLIRKSGQFAKAAVGQGG